jgi:hypothetical protein
VWFFKPLILRPYKAAINPYINVGKNRRRPAITGYRKFTIDTFKDKAGAVQYKNS